MGGMMGVERDGWDDGVERDGWDDGVERDGWDDGGGEGWVG